jgi:hypothetical protein
MAGEVFSGWEEVRLTLGNGHDGLRVVAAIYDPQGRPGAISDMVATQGGLKQQSAGGRVEPDGRIEGTYWQTEGDRHTPRPLMEKERDGLRALARALQARCSSATPTPKADPTLPGNIT